MGIINSSHFRRSSVFRWVAIGIVLVLIAVVLVPQVELCYQLFAARRALKLREATLAIEHLRRAEQLSPNNSETQFLLGRAFRRLGELDLVRTHLERAWKLGFPEKTVKREEILAMAQAGQLREAEPHLSELLVSPGEDGPEICEAFAKGFYLTYRLGHAFSLLEVWQADFPSDPQPLFMRGMLESLEGNQVKGVESLRRARTLAPTRRDIQNSLADLLVKAHEYQEAEDLLRPLLKGDPDNPVLIVQLGTCLMERGELEQSRELFEQAIRLKPDAPTARLAMGQLELRLGHPELAIGWLEPLAAERPYDPQTRFSLASTLQSFGKSEEAKEHFRFVEQAQKAVARMHNMMDQVKKRSDDVELRHEIGMILMQYESPSEGARWLRSVLELQPKHRPTHAALAEYYRSIGNAKLAQQHLLQAEDDDGANG